MCTAANCTLLTLSPRLVGIKHALAHQLHHLHWPSENSAVMPVSVTVMTAATHAHNLYVQCCSSHMCRRSD